MDGDGGRIRDARKAWEEFHVLTPPGRLRSYVSSGYTLFGARIPPVSDITNGLFEIIPAAALHRCVAL
jgi:hypothetical protein